MSDRESEHEISERSILEEGSSKYELLISKTLNKLHELQNWKEQGLLEEHIDVNGADISLTIEERFTRKVAKLLKVISGIIDVCKRREDELTQDPFLPQRHGSIFRKVITCLNDDDEFLDLLITQYALSKNFEMRLHSLKILSVVSPSIEPERDEVILEELIDFLNENENHVIYRLFTKEEQDQLRVYSTGLVANQIQDRKIADLLIDRGLIVPLLKRLKYLVEKARSNINGTLNLSETHNIKEVSSTLNRKRTWKEFTNEEEKSNSRRWISSKGWAKTKFGVDKKGMKERNGKSLMDKGFSVFDMDELSHILMALSWCGSYQEVLTFMIEEEVISMYFYLIEHSIMDRFMLYCILRALDSCLAHRKLALDFLDMKGLELLLSLPQEIYTIGAISLCFFVIASIGTVLEKICLAPMSLKTTIVLYNINLLTYPSETAQQHSAGFFELTLSFRAILDIFDTYSGGSYLLTMLQNIKFHSTHLIHESSKQVLYHGMLAWRQYFRMHLHLLVDMVKRKMIRKLPKEYSYLPLIIPTYKNTPMDIETIKHNLLFMEKNSDLTYFYLYDQEGKIRWKPLLLIQGGKTLFEFLFKLIIIGTNWPRGEISLIALEILRIISLLFHFHLPLLKTDIINDFIFIDHVENDELGDSSNLPGIATLLSFCEGNLVGNVEVQIASLHLLCNLVCRPTLNSISNKLKSLYHHHSTTSFITIPSKILETDESSLRLIWSGIRQENGIKVLMSLLKCKSPPLYADTIRYLSCKALLGLSRSHVIKQMLLKLQITQLLSELIHKPIIEENHTIHEQFKNSAFELIRITSGNDILPYLITHEAGDPTLKKIEKAAIIARTPIDYSHHELLLIVYQYLKQYNLTKTAKSLLKEAHLDVLKLEKFSTSHLSPYLESPHLMTITPKKNLNFSLSSLNRITPKKASHDHELEGISSPIMEPPKLQPPISYGHPHTLENIVTQYLRDKHASCTNPISVLPCFSLFELHQCPEPLHYEHAPINLASRLSRREYKPPYGGARGKKYMNKFLYSRYKLYRVLRDPDSDWFTTCCFSATNSDVIYTGTASGMIKVFDISSLSVQEMIECSDKPVGTLVPSPVGTNIIVGFNSHAGCQLWSTDRWEDMKHEFEQDYMMNFDFTGTKLLGISKDEAHIYDTETCHLIETLKSNSKHRFRDFNGSFNLTNDLVIFDGILWDWRVPKSIHKFDKFSNYGNNCNFHPNGLEIIINSEVWDLRSFKLLQTIPALNRTKTLFNHYGDIFYALPMQLNRKKSTLSHKTTSFRTFDASDYSPIATIDISRMMNHLTIEFNDQLISTVETEKLGQTLRLDNTCRIYKIGVKKSESNIDLDQDLLDEEEEDENENLSEDESDESENEEEEQNDIIIDEENMNTPETLSDLDEFMQDLQEWEVHPTSFSDVWTESDSYSESTSSSISSTSETFFDDVESNLSDLDETSNPISPRQNESI